MMQPAGVCQSGAREPNIECAHTAKQVMMAPNTTEKWRMSWNARATASVNTASLGWKEK